MTQQPRGSDPGSVILAAISKLAFPETEGSGRADFHHRILRLALDVFDADQGYLLLTSEEKPVRIALAFHNGLYKAVDDAVLPGEQYLKDVGEGLLYPPGPPDLNRFEDVGTCIAAPLMEHVSSQGYICVIRNSSETPYQPSDLNYLKLYGGYVQVALDNYELKTTAFDRTRELGLLVESSNAVSSTLDLPSVLYEISRHMMRTLDSDWCIISSAGGEPGQYRSLAEYCRAIWLHGGGIRISLDQHPFHHRVCSGELSGAHLWAGNHSRQEAGYLAEQHYERMMIMPIVERNVIRGLVETASQRAEHPYQPAQFASCQRATAELAAVLRDKHEDEKRSKVDLLMRHMLAATESDMVSASIFNHESNSLERFTIYGTRIWSEGTGPELVIDQYKTLRIVTQEQRIGVLRTGDEKLALKESDLFAMIGKAAMLILPLVYKGRTVGLVQLLDVDEKRDFPSREMALAHTLAIQAAIALENAQLVRDLQRSLEEQRAMQSHIVHAARLSALGEMSAVVAHQINNPLTTIIGDAEMLVLDIPEDNPMHASAVAIQRAGQRAKVVVARLLNMARKESEQTEIDINRSIEDTLELLGPQFLRQPIKVISQLEADLPRVKAIPGQMEDVWMNLLSNARDAILETERKGGEIYVSSGLDDSGKMIVVTVADSGTGISAAELEHIFEPLFTTKPRGKGTGLGLYICRQIVQQHGGSIQVSSVTGGGTTVTVLIPVSDGQMRIGNGIHLNHR